MAVKVERVPIKDNGEYDEALTYHFKEWEAYRALGFGLEPSNSRGIPRIYERGTCEDSVYNCI